MFSPIRIALILVWSLLLSVTAQAQNTESYGSARLEPPDTSEFPIIHSYLEAFNDQGGFIHDLQPENVTILENEGAVPVSSLEEIKVGAQFVIAVNLGPALGIRDSNGISRYDSIQAAFENWAINDLSVDDDVSFLTNDKPDQAHLDNIAQFIAGLKRYDTDPRVSVPSLDVLVRAINIASDPTPRIGMGRSILFITPPPDRTSSATLQSIISLARQERIRIFVWMASSPDLFTSESAALLVELANQSGGQFFAFSGAENLPDIEDYLAPLRYVYSFSYNSQIRNTQTHQIAVKINTDDLDIISPPEEFYFQVEPPNPMLLSPPLEIIRSNRSTLNETLSENADYTPKVQTLEILVEYPDDLDRPLERTILYVDRDIVDENTTPPFDQFTWDLSGYTSDGQHIIHVEVVDSLGLKGTSIENSVQIKIEQTPQSVISIIAQNAPIIAGATAAVFGGILILILIIRGQIKPRSFGRYRRSKDSADTTPTGIIPAPQETVAQRRRISNWVNRFSWPQRPSVSHKPIAYLEMLDGVNNDLTKERIPIEAEEITFGRDPKLATTIFSDPAVNDLHARVRVSEKGDITIQDEDSAAGTWVNYSPISSERVKLSHGDIIHIGRIGLCLKMTDKNKIPKPIVRSQETGS
jgi:hypothetical protein